MSEILSRLGLREIRYQENDREEWRARPPGRHHAWTRLRPARFGSVDENCKTEMGLQSAPMDNKRRVAVGSRWLPSFRTA
jgi:hypothetical protein